ncbi:MAG TPA: glycosyltransferase family 1 protein [Ohtaekwangia sp.]|uniref:glycosyltransferase family 4 protein n=1 Tax=Ohtaekwangia sp. TaxID=2066019 RepID=UPI002F93D4D1
MHELKESFEGIDIDTIYFSRGSGKLTGLVRKYFVLPFNLLRIAPEFVILPSERYAFLLPFLRASRSLIVCHDLHTLMDRNGRWYFKCIYKWNLKLMRLATWTVCISEHTKSDLLHAVKFNPEKVRTIYNGLKGFWLERNTSTENSILKQLQVEDRPYALLVGSKVWYKNQFRTFKALSESKYQDLLIIKVGDIEEEAQRLINSTSLMSRTIVVRNVSDIDLRTLYQRAAIFLFPSIHEGFGWPALEAMASGCPVIATRKGSLEEVCGDAARYVDPYNEKEIATAMDDLLQNEDLRIELTVRGSVNARRFSWRTTAQQMKDLLLRNSLQ